MAKRRWHRQCQRHRTCRKRLKGSKGTALIRLVEDRRTFSLHEIPQCSPFCGIVFSPLLRTSLKPEERKDYLYEFQPPVLFARCDSTRKQVV